MTYSIYDINSGMITSRVRNANQIMDRPHVLGNYEPGRFYVKDSQVRLLPDRPESQSQVAWRWNLNTENWEYDEARSDQNARKIRQKLFAEVDKINPMWFESMTDAQREQVRVYRQAILDITDQVDYPRVIDWPTKPAWL